MSHDERIAMLRAEPEGTFLTLVYPWSNRGVIAEVYKKVAADRWTTHPEKLRGTSWESDSISESLGYIGGSAIWSLS